MLSNCLIFQCGFALRSPPPPFCSFSEILRHCLIRLSFSFLTAIDPVDPPSNGVITFPSPQPGQSLFVIRNSITGEIARLSPTTRTYTLPISTFPAGPQEITVETERGVVLVRYRLVIPGKSDSKYFLHVFATPSLHMCCL